MDGFAKCILCRSAPPIKKSHVIPKFVFKWMVATGGSSYLRYAGSPNKRVQDGLKLPLLCQRCESDIGIAENNFSQHIFKPSVQEQKMPKKLGAIHYKFVCSLHFRVIAYLLKYSADPDFYSAEEKRLILSTFIRMRRYLKNEAYSISPCKLYLLPLGVGQLNSFAGLPTNWNRFIRRHAELDIFGSENGNILGSYAKFGPWISVCLIKNDGQPWIGGELVPRSRKVYDRNSVLPPYLLGYLIDRAKKSQKALEQLSNTQHDIIDEQLKNADFVVAGRQMFDALHADYEAFGLDAFRKK